MGFLDVTLRVEHSNGHMAIAERLQKSSGHQPRVRGALAEVIPKPKGNMRVGAPVQDNLLGILERSR